MSDEVGGWDARAAGVGDFVVDVDADVDVDGGGDAAAAVDCERDCVVVVAVHMGYEDGRIGGGTMGRLLLSIGLIPNSGLSFPHSWRDRVPARSRK